MNAIHSVLKSNMIGEGPKVKEFTETLMKLFTTPRVTCLNSCTSALEMACVLSDVKGKEVISTPFTMVATNTAIEAAGGKIVFHDIDPDTLCLDLESLPGKINENTAAVMLTLVGGVLPNKFDMIYTLPKHVKVILDCAHALGTKYCGVHISKLADFACFSFQSIKHLSTGDGGAVVNYDPVYDDRIKRMKWFGMTRDVPPGKTRLQLQMEQDIVEAGRKWHMNDLAAALGIANMPLAMASLEKSKENGNYYQTELEDLETQGHIRRLKLDAETTPSWWVYGFLAEDRNKLLQHMLDGGIEATQMWKRNDKYTFAKKHVTPFLPNMDMVEKDIIFIPNGWWVTPENRNFIVQTIREFYKK